MSTSKDLHKAASLSELVMMASPTSAAAEAYRTLRANLQPKVDGSAPKTILFTSTGPEVDHTTVLANVGIAAAAGGARVVLVDADLRRPSLHEIFRLTNAEGLATCLRQASDDVMPQRTTIDGLWVLPSGPPPANPVELLSQPSMKTLLDELSEGADLVMLDSPPAGPLADASVLAGWVDGVVLVLDARRTRREQATRAKDQLDRVHARMLGTVVSNADVDTAGYRY
jgi:capsular exopolysaccharide synthesis family protein